jgi:hypothetical protein
MANTGNIDIDFDFSNNNITINGISINDNNGITTYTNLETNSTQLGQPNNIQNYMKIRTICDIIKDGTNATIAVPKDDLILLLRRIFGDDLVNIAAEPTKLEEIKANSNNICKNDITGRVFIKSAYVDHIPLQLTHVFNESGVAPDTFAPEGVKIMSSFASVADPASRREPGESFPGKNLQLKFNTGYMAGLVGFLSDTSWCATQTSVFQGNQTKYKFQINVGNNAENNVGNNAENNVDGGTINGNDVTNENITTKNFDGGYYFQGNPTKNKYIYNKISKNPQNLQNLQNQEIQQIMRYMIIKEMGDMMQVYVMLVWYYLQKQENPQQISKDKFVMSTTDLVVMNTCQLFKMPCLYTNQGKNDSMLGENDKKQFDEIFEKIMTEKENGREKYKSWKNNNKFANTLYYLPDVFEDTVTILKKRLEMIHYVIKSQNEKQLAVVEKAKNNLNDIRYIKMGRLGPLLTSFNNDNLQEIIEKIIKNIEKINQHLYVDFTTYHNNITNKTITNETIEEELKKLKKNYSLNILITRQKYPPGGNSYVYVLQNMTHYTEKYAIGNGTQKLVDMILDNDNFVDVPEPIQQQPIQEVMKFPKTKIISGRGPNENWLIYSIANWFNGVYHQINNVFGKIFEPFRFFDDLNTMDWMGVGGMNHRYGDNDTNRLFNNLNQPYIHIGFVSMIPCIYEQLCNIYEKHNVVFNDEYGKIFIKEFIFNLTRYMVDENGLNSGPNLKPPYNDIGRPYPEDFNLPDYPFPYFTNIIPSLCVRIEPYNKYVKHSDDMVHEKKVVEDAIIIEKDNEVLNELKETKEELDKIQNNKNSLIINNGLNPFFTVDDTFAKKLFEMSGLSIINQEYTGQVITDDTDEILEVEQQETQQQQQGTEVDDDPLITPERVTRQSPTGPQQVTPPPATPINSPEKLKELFKTPDNKTNFLDEIVEPLKQFRPADKTLQQITESNIQDDENTTYLSELLNSIKSGETPIDNNDLREKIFSYIKTGTTPIKSVPFFSLDGGKRGKHGKPGNNKTKKRIRKSHDMKHHKTNKKNKYTNTCKNKTRKIIRRNPKNAKNVKNAKM